MNFSTVKTVLDNTKVFVLSGKNSYRTHRCQYLQAYDCWKQSWEKAFSGEMKLKDQLFSDDFTRQDDIVALYYKETCVGLAFSKYVDLHNSVLLQDSYFRSWPKDYFVAVQSIGPILSAASYFTVNKQFRGKDHIIVWKHLLIELFVRNFRESGADCMVAAARKNKSNEKTTYLSGAFSLGTNLDYHIENETIDLVCWKKPFTSELDETITYLADSLWEKYLLTSKQQRQQENVEYRSTL